jgi:hypothetical protein
VKLKVHDAPDVGICVTCRNGLVMQHDTSNVVHCNYGTAPLRIAQAVRQCTGYEDRRHEDEFEMRKIAWTIRTDRSGQTVGFAPPSKDDETRQR